jgi:hypothetical protein
MMKLSKIRCFAIAGLGLLLLPLFCASSQACVVEILFSKYWSAGGNKRACEESLNRITYEAQKVVDKYRNQYPGLALKLKNDGLTFGHTDDKFFSCEPTSSVSLHPLGYYVNVAIVNASSGIDALRDSKFCKEAEDHITALRLDNDIWKENRTVPSADSARSAPDTETKGGSGGTTEGTNPAD